MGMHPHLRSRWSVRTLTVDSFGAVLEEFEVRDALEGVYVSKLPAVEQAHFASQPIAVAA